MSDWELVPDNEGDQSQDSSPLQSSSDWEVVQQAPVSQRPNQNEGLGWAAAKAPFRILDDLYTGGINAIKSIPGYLDAAKTEVPGVLNPMSNPLHRLGQAGAGLTELGHGLLNAPRGLADYASNRLNLIPQSYAEKVPYQKDISGDIDEVFGKASQPGDSLIRGATRNALNLIGVGKAASVLNPMNLTAKSIAKDVLNTAESNKKLYGGMYDNLWKDASNKGFDNAMYNVNIDIPTLQKFSPKKSIKGVLDFDQNPTLQNAHTAKSDLLRLQRDLNKLPTLRSAERQQLKAVNDGIDSIQGNMFKDASGKVDQGMLDKYQTIQQGYANEVIPYKNKAINKFRRNEISAKELVNSLSRGEFAAKRGSFHPEIKYRNAFKDHPYLTGAGIGGLGKMLYDNMMGNQAPEQ